MTRVPFEYAVLLVVPRAERGESMNAGVLVYCRDLDYLQAQVALDTGRLRALDPGADVRNVRAALDAVADDCAAGAAGAQQVRNGSGEDLGRRFRRLTAPRSTVVRAGPVHTGLTTDPAAESRRLLQLLVLPLPGATDQPWNVAGFDVE
jgi:hypothetical protein